MRDNTVQLIILFGIIGLAAAFFTLFMLVREGWRRRRSQRSSEPHFEPDAALPPGPETGPAEE